MTDELFDIIIETAVGETKSKLRFKNAECYERYIMANTTMAEEMFISDRTKEGNIKH